MHVRPQQWHRDPHAAKLGALVGVDNGDDLAKGGRLLHAVEARNRREAALAGDVLAVPGALLQACWPCVLALRFEERRGNGQANADQC